VEPKLVIVAGPPASGKTTLAQRLASHFSLPLMTKDMIKEILFDTLGWSDAAWSQRLGQASTALLLRFAQAQLAAQRSCVIDCNFVAKQATAGLLSLQQRHPFEPIQILCRADYAILIERLMRRADAGERHPGHIDHIRVADFSIAYLQAQSEPLAIGGQLIELDTTDFAAIDYTALWEQLAL
jgi:nicotinamide riboside kinase